MRRRRILFAAALMLAPAGASAQDRPVLEPVRDYAATYRATGNGAGQTTGRPAELRLSWLASAQTLRIDRPGYGYALHDRRAGSLRVVMDGNRFAMSLPAGANGRIAGFPTRPGPAARFTREGTETVAGMRCTQWRVEDGADRGRLCVTAEGILLRGEGEANGRRGRIEAVSVSVAPQDAARFRLPAGVPTVPLPTGLLSPRG